MEERKEGGREGRFVCGRTAHQWDAVRGTEKDGFHVWVPEEELVKCLLDTRVLCRRREERREEEGRSVDDEGKERGKRWGKWIAKGAAGFQRVAEKEDTGMA